MWWMQCLFPQFSPSLFHEVFGGHLVSNTFPLLWTLCQKLSLMTKDNDILCHWLLLTFRASFKNWWRFWFHCILLLPCQLLMATLSMTVYFSEWYTPQLTPLFGACTWHCTHRGESWPCRAELRSSKGLPCLVNDMDSRWGSSQSTRGAQLSTLAPWGSEESPSRLFSPSVACCWGWLSRKSSKRPKHLGPCSSPDSVWVPKGAWTAEKRIWERVNPVVWVKCLSNSFLSHCRLSLPSISACGRWSSSINIELG